MLVYECEKTREAVSCAVSLVSVQSLLHQLTVVGGWLGLAWLGSIYLSIHTYIHTTYKLYTDDITNKMHY